MPSPTSSPLTENAGLTFIGEKSWSQAAVTAAQAHSLESARNPTGRPNSDVLRRFIGCKSGRTHEHWQVDFPLHCTSQEANLYVEPCRHLRSKLSDVTGAWWLNPHAQPELRTAVARLERYLATPLGEADLAWDWIDSNLLPDESLLIVARDDDFTKGLLDSQLFVLWWRQHAARISPASVAASFPFPWPPATLLSSLSRAQEELRLDLARAARGSDRDRLRSAAAAAYGWPDGLTDEELLAGLIELNRQRSTAGRDR